MGLSEAVKWKYILEWTAAALVFPGGRSALHRIITPLMKGNWWAWRGTSECKLLQFWDCKALLCDPSHRCLCPAEAEATKSSLPCNQHFGVCSADLEGVQLLLFLTWCQWWAITGAMERNLYYDWGLFQCSIRAFPVFCVSLAFSMFPPHIKKKKKNLLYCRSNLFDLILPVV